MTHKHTHTCRALALMLGYPDERLFKRLPDLAHFFQHEAALARPQREALVALANSLLRADALDVQARYVQWFDRGRRTSLHLFEHVHGDSRDRGPAMIDLGQTYAQAGLLLEDGELPDYLPAVLEFASIQPPEIARSFLAEMAHILHALHTALVERESPYAAVIAAVIELAGEKPQKVKLAPEEALDASWAEPEAFGGCNSAGQNKPGQPQPVQFVRKSADRAQGAVA